MTCLQGLYRLQRPSGDDGGRKGGDGRDAESLEIWKKVVSQNMTIRPLPHVPVVYHLSPPEAGIGDSY